MKKLLALTFVASALIPSVASADFYDVTLTAPTSRTDVYSANNAYARAFNYDLTDVSLSVTAFSNDGSGGAIIQDYVGGWSGGLGAEIGGNPNHTLDNKNNDFDMLLFTFSEAVNLESIFSDYRYTDSDASVLLKTGPTVSTVTAWGDLMSNGWESAGDYTNVDSSGSAINSNKFSDKWLVGAYNPIYNGDVGITVGNDNFKLKSIRFSTHVTPPPEPPVPTPVAASEPGTLMILLSGLFGLIASRRRMRVS